ncbi:hypothetical protein I4U23_005240 [Adineta vaga]|nr:hypothetical protein I4U23_005240 [Adineta vaga]
MTSFEDLSNEIFYEIFEFLHSYEAFHSFYGINQRFRNLFINSNHLITVDISSKSESILQRYFNHIIVPHAPRIKSLRLFDSFAHEIFLSLTITLNKLDNNYVRQIIDQLFCLSTLSSLTIRFADDVKIPRDIYIEIIHLPTLKYCQISLNECKLLPCAYASASSSIEHLVLNESFNLEQFDDLLSYVPKLRCLIINDFCGFSSKRTKRSLLSWSSLTKVCIQMRGISFDDFYLIATDYFRHVQALNVMIYPYVLENSNMEYLDADRWKNLISNCMPELRSFNLKHMYYVGRGEFDWLNYGMLIDKFNSSFWMIHKWFFEYEFSDMRKILVFFSKKFQ